MKRLSIIFLLLISISFISAIPNDMTIQIKVSEDFETPVNYNISLNFTIYDSYTEGNILWNDRYYTKPNNGLATVILQDINLNFSNDYYLGVKIGNDEEALPRTNLTTNPYAFRSNSSDYFQEYTPLTFRNWVQLAFNNIYCKLTGCEMTGNIEMNANSVTNLSSIIFSNGDSLTSNNSILITINGQSRLLLGEVDSIFSGDVKNVDNLNDWSRFSETNVNNETNAVAGFTATNADGDELKMGITARGYNTGNPNLVGGQGGIFLDSNNNLGFSIGYKQGYNWRNNPFNDGEHSNTTDVLMKLDKNGNLNITGYVEQNTHVHAQFAMSETCNTVISSVNTPTQINASCGAWEEMDNFEFDETSSELKYIGEVNNTHVLFLGNANSFVSASGLYTVTMVLYLNGEEKVITPVTYGLPDKAMDFSASRVLHLSTGDIINVKVKSTKATTLSTEAMYLNLMRTV